MERPKCDWAAGDCERPANWVVAFVHGNRFRLSCKDHLDDWHKNGAGYWCSELRGFIGDMGHVVEDAPHDDEHRGDAYAAPAVRAPARDGCENVGEEEVTMPEPGS